MRYKMHSEYSRGLFLDNDLAEGRFTVEGKPVAIPEIQLGADPAGVLRGARVPVILTSRADAERTRMASCAVAVLIARAQAKAAPTIMDS